MHRRTALVCLAGLLLTGCAGEQPIDPSLSQVTIEVKGMS